MKKTIIKNSIILLLLLISTFTFFYYLKGQDTVNKEWETSMDNLTVYRSDPGKMIVLQNEEVCTNTDTSSYTVKNTGKEDKVIKSSDFLLLVNGSTYKNDSEDKQVTLIKGEEASFDLKFEYMLPLETIEGVDRKKQHKMEYITSYPISVVLVVNDEDKLEIHRTEYSCSQFS